MSHLLALLLSTTPVVVEPLGFTVVTEDGEVRVAAVQPGSAAEKAGLVPGVVLERLVLPTWMWRPGPLPTLTPDELRRALTPPHGEPLLVQGRHGESKRPYAMERTDAPPPPIDRILSAEETKELSMRQYALYQGEVHLILRRRRAAAEPPRPALALDGVATASVGDEVLEVRGGGYTSRWVYWAGRIQYACPKSPMRRIELTAAAPVKRVVATSADAYLRGASVEAELPLWTTGAVREACRRGATSLPSPPLKGALVCEGEAPIPVDLSTTLALECGAKREGERWRFDVLRVKPIVPPLVGESGALQLEVRWRTSPRPAAVTVLETDEKGALLKRHVTVRAPASGEESHADVTIDTRRARTLHLVPELAFDDGAVDRGAPQKLTLETKAQRDADIAKMNEEFRQVEVVLARLRAWRGDFCSTPDEAVAWLERQPEVSRADNHHGHSLSFVVGETPFTVICHER